MMSVGVEVFDSSGAKTLAVIDDITRLVYSITAPAGASGSGTLAVSAAVLAKCKVLVTPLTTGPGAMGHHAAISGYVVSWSPVPVGSHQVAVASRVEVMAYG